MMDLTKDELRILAYLKLHWTTFVADLDDEDYGWCLSLKEKKLVAIELPDPNFLYQLSPEKQNQYQVKITSEGLNQLALHQERLQNKEEADAKREEERRADNAKAVKDKKKDYRHDFLVAAFGGAVTLLFEHRGDIIHFVNVLLDQIWIFLSH